MRFAVLPSGCDARPYAVVDSWRQREAVTYTRRDYATRRARADNLAAAEDVAALARGVAAYTAAPIPAASVVRLA